MFSQAEWIQMCVCNGIKCTTNNCFLQIMLLFPSGWLINSVRAGLLSVLLITVVNGVVYHPFPPQELGIHSLAVGCVACWWLTAEFFPGQCPALRELLCPRLCPLPVTRRLSMSHRWWCVSGGCPSLPQFGPTLKGPPVPDWLTEIILQLHRSWNSL